jgi:hypothetical protein
LHAAPAATKLRALAHNTVSRVGLLHKADHGDGAQPTFVLLP